MGVYTPAERKGVGQRKSRARRAFVPRNRKRAKKEARKFTYTKKEKRKKRSVAGAPPHRHK